MAMGEVLEVQDARVQSLQRSRLAHRVTFLGRIIDFFTLLFLARILTPADFGLAALAMSLVVVVDTVLEVPVTQALVRLNVINKSHLTPASR